VQATPLSRQLIEAAADGCDLTTAEGRAHMLANAKPLWTALPEGTLKRQLLTEIAGAARDEVDQLLRQWGHAPARAAARDAAPARVPTRRAGALSKGTANLLDRAIWLLLQRSDLWATLDGESHDFLAGQAAPYDLFFGAIERSIHEHGALSFAALLDELRQHSADAPHAVNVIKRIAEFHASDANVDVARELALVLDGLRLRAVRDELDLMVEGGLTSPDAHQRFKLLNGELARLKNLLASQQNASN